MARRTRDSRPAGELLRIAGLLLLVQGGVLSLLVLMFFHGIPAWALFTVGATTLAFGVSLLARSSVPPRLRTQSEPATEPLRHGAGDVPLGWLLAFLARATPEDMDHAERVATLAVELAKVSGLPAEEVQRLHWGGLLHDIGKIMIDPTLLNKAGRLTENELEAIRRHPETGANLVLAACPAATDVAACVNFHHERWDGSGYPLGLRESEIPMNARIIAIADVFEALTSDRPYRPALTEYQALTYIEDAAGTHFDPSITQAFVALVRQRSRHSMDFSAPLSRRQMVETTRV